MRAARLLVLGSALAIVAHGCGGEDRPFLDESGDVPEPGDGDNTPDQNSDDDASLPPVISDAAPNAEGGSSDGGPAPVYVAENCGGVTCAGTRRCVQDNNGAYCDCDTGFIKTTNDDDGFECILDEECVYVRALTQGCRHNLGVDPLVTLSFTVEYCGGVPVPPDVVGNLDSAFALLEDEEPVDLNESAAVAVSSSAGLIVTVALDVSGSVLANEQVLSPLVGQLRGFVEKLKRPAGQPPVTVTVLVFGRTVAEYVAPTVDLDAVDSALAAIETDQTRVTDLVQTNGTALYDAVAEAVHNTDSLILTRQMHGQGGTLASGTVVVVTDGNNESGSVGLNTAVLDASLSHIVSVGINADIDDRQLSAIGRDGSFLAPNPGDWQITFDEIASRITDRLQSVYRVAYCSPSTTANHQLQVGLVNIPTAAGLSCGFDAGNFAEQPPPSLDAGVPPANVFASCQQFIADQCDLVLNPNDNIRLCDTTAMACGSECLPDECCNGWGVCVSPTPTTGDCRAQDELCRPGNKRCADPDGDGVFTCENPTPLGQDCSKVGCEEGVGQCLPDTNDAGAPIKICQAISRDLGDACEIKEPDPQHQCSTLNCAKDPDQNADIFYCRPPAQMFDLCGGANAAAVCPSGTQCKGGKCVARVIDGPCSAHADCVSGTCDKAVKRCIPSTTCHFAWDEKVGQ